jgi:PhnB protein
MLGVNPYIAFKGNCRQAIEFYKDALDAEVLFTQTVGESRMADMGPVENITHCTIKVGDSTIMMCDDPRPDASAGGGNISLANRPERSRARQASLWKPCSERFGDYAARKDILGGSIRVTDKFGVKWMVNCDAPK